MGLWKRVSEKTKQAVGLKAASTVDWRPTSNARNLAMIEEVRRCSKQIKSLHRELRDLQARIDGNLGLLKSVLNSPLPRVYEMSDKGAVPVEREASIVGSGVAFDLLTATGSELKAKLQQEVLHPLDQWQAAYRMIKSRNVKCEELRLELDAKRRETAAMAVSLDKLKSKVLLAAAAEGDKSGGEAAGAVAAGPTGATNKFEDAEFKLQKEEDKVARLTQRYQTVEEEVYTALLTLINDTKVLKQYAATALVVFQQGFAQAYTAFGPGAGVLELEMPLPTSSISISTSTPQTKGQVASQCSAIVPSSGGNPKGGPDTPEQQSQPPSAQGPPNAPTWYHDARRNAAPMSDYSDDDN